MTGKSKNETKSPGVAYWGGVVLLFAAIGGVAGWLIIPDDANAALQTGAMVVGRAEVDFSKSTEHEARRIARDFAQGKLKLHYDDFERELTRDKLGLRVNQAELSRLIDAWRDPESTLRKYRDVSSVRGPIAVPVPVVLDFKIASRTLLGIKEEFDREAADAHIDLEKGRVVPEKVGRRLNVYATASNLEWSARGAVKELRLSVVTVEPRVRDKSLAKIDFDTVLGWFETPYSQMHKDRHRTYNLKLAAQKLHGQVVEPGKVFSFNDTVGERTEANGYRVATVIAAGQLVDGMGGGTCQIAGTLHAAAFFAGLDIVKREPHSRPSSYIRVGLDATVSYPNIDLKLRNPFPYPIVIGMTLNEGKVRGEIFGPDRDLTVTYIRTILETKEPPRRTIEDSSMPRGVETVEQRGVPGVKVKRIRIFNRGTAKWRRVGYDRYPPTTHIVKVGTNSALAPPEGEQREPPRPFPEPCNMRITQGPDGLFDEQTACRNRK